MKKLAFLAAAAAVTALVASPALAQDTAQPRAAKQASAKQMKHASKTGMKHASKSGMKQHARADRGYRQARVARTDEMANRSAYLPGNVVGGAIGTAGAGAGAAIGTAGAIATAPFGGPGYYNAGYYSGGYPYGNRQRYGGAYAATNVGWNQGYSEEYSYNGLAM